jgi:AAA domain
MKQRTLLALLSDENTLRDDNLWWRGERMFGLPTMRRWAFEPVVAGLKIELTPVTVLRGPRQIGKTTLLNQVSDGLLDEGVSPKRIFRVQFDELPQLKQVSEPILDLSRWFSPVVGIFLRLEKIHVE